MTKQQKVTNSEASSRKMLTAMVGIGVICAFLIVVTFQGTLPIIEKNRQEALEQAIFKVIPGITKTTAFQLMADETFGPLGQEKNSDSKVYAGYDSAGNFQGLAIEARAQGYGDILSILYGYNLDSQKIVGFYVLESKETPGLGDKIEKDANFLENFKALDVSTDKDNKGLNHKVILVKNGSKSNPWEIDGISGATISSRAVTNAIITSSEKWMTVVNKNKAFFTKKASQESKENQ